ncbi:MAG: GTP-binding protein [Myxococcaceae bacterium]
MSPSRLLALAAVLVSASAQASFINYSSREINVKIVYVGPPGSGAAENLRYIYGKTNPEAKGKLIELKTDEDSTLFFDFVPLSLGEIRGFKVRFHLYTAVSAKGNEAVERLILKGVDGVVFVADSDPGRAASNVAAFARLDRHLADQGYDRRKMPLVVQLDRRDHPKAMSIEAMKKALKLGAEPAIAAESRTGVGVFDSLKAIAKAVLMELKKGADSPAPDAGLRK